MNSIVDCEGQGPTTGQKPSFRGYGAFSDEGYNSSYNQDALLMATGIGKDQSSSMFGIFDGHGTHGDKVANTVKDTLYKSFATNFEASASSDPASVAQSLMSSFIETQRELEKKGDQFLLTGTTASVAFIQKEILHLAHVGDSRVVIGRECVCCSRVNRYLSGQGKAPLEETHIIAFAATVDHRVGELPEERARVEKAGGEVKLDPNLPPDAWDEMRIYAPGQKYPGLVTSRSLGDLLGHSLGVIPTPEISAKELDENDKILIIASDGVWDILSNQDAINLVSCYSDPSEATNALVDACVKGWSDEYDVGDNVSAIVLFLNDFEERKSSKESKLPAPTCAWKWTWQQLCEKKDIEKSLSELNRARHETAESMKPTPNLSATSKKNDLKDGKETNTNASAYVEGALIHPPKTKMCQLL
eukprot:TRINITY_DN6829_c0_g1_i2.p1 TRINITY_DN6829_c0_g1~~TRINITY_DN6829_c0_g1_i2.p1  ORF type:complete len:417 (+),score=95.94 TRINITY_DN6829_c0_g1_i2:626-1876(+)